ncbi:RIO kinase 2 [Halohasta litchfieldiae]|jgi:RIO kinase 2|uniref:non-specific serine/threonine protein kinase n=1 Tax=Halohasta litchfieldiae TaxID=1073996 RepID=A0A1H6UQY7_9EURY|nr:serine/threonine-protein kinase RIO2 [Halohasta litchfieldiae]ATW88427.1 RIO kinase 2 [Halohasta litchfieldiae]SEI94803.1 RIO kinase 2 [Halohasta litchfieldiae]
MVQNVASFFRELEPADFYLLSGIEQGMRFSEWVQREQLPKYSSLTSEEVDYRLDRCMKHELIQRKTIQYEGYQLTFEGYDVLALRSFSERDTIEGVGSPLGVGKESDVYEAMSFQPLALKYHREGYTNFRAVDREREYTSDRNHVSWLYTARKAAEKEYEALESLYPDVSVPRPVDQNRHAIVMEKLDGAELSRARLESQQVVGVLDLVLEEMTGAYHEGYVHADMSEYNVFVDEDGITIFDWPQAVPTDHENSDELLARDLKNIYGYFRRKYPSETPESVDLGVLADDIVDDELESIRSYAEP